MSVSKWIFGRAIPLNLVFVWAIVMVMLVLANTAIVNLVSTSVELPEGP